MLVISTLDGQRRAITIQGKGAVVTVDDNVIERMGDGIIVDQGAEPIIENNEITDSGAGISVQGSDGTVRANAVSDGEVGIVIVGGTPTVVDNSVEGVSGRGFAIGGATDVTLAGNTACGNGTNVWTPDDADPALAEGIEICEEDLAE